MAKALMSQSAAKAPGPDQINFQILRMIWNWDKSQITSLVEHAIQLGYHSRKWKKARGILLEKGGKRDFGLVRSYRVISLLRARSATANLLIRPVFYSTRSEKNSLALFSTLLEPGSVTWTCLLRRKYVLSKDTLMILLHLCQYFYICVNTEYILYVLYFCLIVIHISLSQSIVPHDKSYVFLSLDRNTVRFKN